MQNIYQNWKIYTMLLVLFFVATIANGKHIVGGDVTYECKGISSGKATFEITFTLYRDSKSGGAQFDSPALFGLFKGGGNNWEIVRTFQKTVTDVENISIDTGNPCLAVPQGIGVQSGKYIFEIVLPISEIDSYMVTYQRCCRNNTIFNILNSEETGAAFSVTISPMAQKECDNSPTFNDFPPVVICANQLLNFDHSASDQDGDQVVYSFCNPVTSGGPEGVSFGNKTDCNGITPDPGMCPPPFDFVRFRAPNFSFDKPMGPNIGINPNTGFISGIPRQTEQFVVGVCATTYRNGVEIGKISRDFQFNVTTCEVAVDAAIEGVDIDGEKFIIESCGQNTVDFNNESTDESKIFSYLWKFYIGQDSVEFTERDISYTFPDTGQYKGFLFLNNMGNFENCRDTAEISVKVYPSVEADFAYVYDTCIAGPVMFDNKSVSGAGIIKNYTWDFGSGQSEEKDPTFKYNEPGKKNVKLSVVDINECESEVEKEITWYPVPPAIVVDPTSFSGCAPQGIQFNNLSTPIDSTYDITWNFGDGGTSKDISPFYVFKDAGLFSINVDIVSPIGCKIERNFDSWIEMFQGPTAGFSFLPEEPSVFNKTVTFTDESKGAISWLYTFGDIGLLERNPTYTFQDTGLVVVKQIVTNDIGCTDTLGVELDVKPLVTLHVPNAFTPNNDGVNDVFRGTGFYDGFRDYTMTIWNRWGETVYTGNDPVTGWNGRKNNTGGDSPVEVYVYTIHYTGPRGETKELRGHVTLIR